MKVSFIWLNLIVIITKVAQSVQRLHPHMREDVDSQMLTTDNGTAGFHGRCMFPLPAAGRANISRRARFQLGSSDDCSGCRE